MDHKVQAGWNYNLFGCFEDKNLCMLSTFCPCYVFGKVAYTVDKSCLLWGILLLIPFVNLIAFGRIRYHVRKTVHIDGVCSDDCVLTMFCAPCALVQEAREVQDERHIMQRTWE